MNSQSPAATMAMCAKARPVLKPLLDMFEPLFAQRLATAARLAPELAQAGLALRQAPGQQPLLQENLLSGLGAYVRKAAQDLLPLLLDQQAIEPFASALEKLFLQNEADCGGLVPASLADTPDAMQRIADKYEVDVATLQFCCSFIVSAVLRALAAPLADSDFPDWRRQYCPVCGSAPILGWLARKPPPANNEFLADGGGRKHLHCGMCGVNWYFLRGICPSCGIHGQDAMQIWGEEDRRHERIDWCKRCNTYLPLIDTRELADMPDLDAMALGLMHLDLVAADKDLIPLKASFWNMF